MIVSFKDSDTKALASGQRVRRFISMESVARRKLRQLEITADTDLRLCRFFQLSNGYWLRAQVLHDTEVTEPALADTLRKIKPWTGTTA